MDDRRFDSLARSLASGANRRQFLQRGSAFAIAAGAGLVARNAEAARRGYSGPKFPTPTPEPCVSGTAKCVTLEGGTSIRICDQGTWQTYDCIFGQQCIPSPAGGNDFCEITT